MHERTYGFPNEKRGKQYSIKLMNTDRLNTELSGESERDRNKRKKVERKGIMSDTFIWEEEEHHF